MSKELVIGSNRHETKVAVLEDDQLVELYFQRANEYSLAGSIHKGRVTRVLPGMQSAFVDVGLERDTFLYVTDFFEEQEDIDAVGDEKPVRSDRRDFSPARGPERVRDQRTQESRERPSTSPESPALEAGETGVVEPETISFPDVTPSSKVFGNRPPERTDDEREFRGDRRGRRSRRRRPKGGQGFPENKYAQPAGPQPRPELPPDVRTAEKPETAADVILLPGESLAKYRNIASTRLEDSGPLERPGEALDVGTPEGPATGSDFHAETDSDEEADLDAQQQEIELADKVLAHHDDPSPAAEEEKLEEVKQDQPSPSSASDIEADERPQSNSVEADQFRSVETAGFAEFDADDANSSGAAVVSIEEVADSETLDFDEPDPNGLDEDSEDLPSSASSETDERMVDPRPSAGLPGPQSAAVREQGGRYLHRASRRMRRRRGGNRFNNPAQETPGTRESSGAASAAATAMEPESRTDAQSDVQEDRSAARPERVMPSITDLLKPGQEIIVQIAKEPLGQKGARITSHVALPGRYVVFMPSVTHAGVSRKIASEEERHRLKRILQTHRAGTTGGFIVRTAGEGVSEEEIAADMNFLYNLWMDIREKAEKKPAPTLLHYDLNVVQRILRDRLTEDFKAIWIDNEELYENVLSFMQRFQPALVSRVKMYTRSAPIFDAFNITQEIEKALRPKVWLKSGGYIVINQTEALVAIDINTGKFVGKSNRLEDTIVKTNTEAIKEIVRQIRLRDLGGIIVVDFIDMDERKNRQKVMQALEEAMRADRAPYKILQFNDFGLVAITRKRVKQSLERTLCSLCPYCDGAGYIKSVQTVVSEILAEAQKIAKAIEGKDVVLRVNPAVAKMLKASSNRYLEEMEDILGRPVLVTSDASLHHEKFDLA
ncbi:MAG: Rne/Rng family ribonuclease [Bryobacteraceae bacterium]